MLPITIGPYRIIRKLGEGGMGVVYEAMNDAIERRVAIKVLHPDYSNDRETASRFFDEARAVNRIEHPSLVQISDYGQTPEGTAYLVMEFLRGESLAQRIHRAHAAGKRLDVSEVVRIAWQTADALRAAHEKHIVHRENYIISTVCFHVGHFRPQRRRNKPCPLTAPAAASSALTSH